MISWTAAFSGLPSDWLTGFHLPTSRDFCVLLSCLGGPALVSTAFSSGVLALALSLPTIGAMLIFDLRANLICGGAGPAGMGMSAVVRMLEEGEEVTATGDGFSGTTEAVVSGAGTGVGSTGRVSDASEEELLESLSSASALIGPSLVSCTLGPSSSSSSSAVGLPASDSRALFEPTMCPNWVPFNQSITAPGAGSNLASSPTFTLPTSGAPEFPSSAVDVSSSGSGSVGDLVGSEGWYCSDSLTGATGMGTYSSTAVSFSCSSSFCWLAWLMAWFRPPISFIAFSSSSSSTWRWGVPSGEASLDWPSSGVPTLGACWNRLPMAGGSDKVGGGTGSIVGTTTSLRLEPAVFSILRANRLRARLVRNSSERTMGVSGTEDLLGEGLGTSGTVSSAATSCSIGLLASWEPWLSLGSVVWVAGTSELLDTMAEASRLPTVVAVSLEDVVGMLAVSAVFVWSSLPFKDCCLDNNAAFCSSTCLSSSCNKRCCSWTSAPPACTEASVANIVAVMSMGLADIRLLSKALSAGIPGMGGTLGASAVLVPAVASGSMYSGGSYASSTSTRDGEYGASGAARKTTSPYQYNVTAMLRVQHKTIVTPIC